MSKDDFLMAADAVLAIDGVYLHSISRFTDGKVSINKSGLIKNTIAIDVNLLGAKVDDIRAIHAPHCFENKLVPMICFIEPDVFMANKRIGQDDGIAAVISEVQP